MRIGLTILLRLSWTAMVTAVMPTFGENGRRHVLSSETLPQTENEFKTLKCSMCLIVFDCIWLSCVQIGSNVPSSFILEPPTTCPQRLGLFRCWRWVGIAASMALREIPRLQTENQKSETRKRPSKAILWTQWLNSYQTIRHMKTHRVILNHFTHVNQGSHWDSLGIFRSHLERPSCWKGRHFQLKCCRVATVFQHTAETNQTSNKRVQKNKPSKDWNKYNSK